MMFSYNYWTGVQGNLKHPEQEAIYGSFRDYWHQMSRGKLKIEGRVVNPDNDQDGVPDWFKANHTKEYYYNLPRLDRTLAIEAIDTAINGGFVDTINTNYDNYFDKLVILYSGVVRSGGSLFVHGDKLHGKFIQLAERSSERLQHSIDWSFTHIGIYLHEFGHNLGFSDEYWNNPAELIDMGEDGGTEHYNFDLMAWGIYNGPLEKGECPATLSPYYRIRNNWVSPDTLTNDEDNFVVEYDYLNPKFYCIVPVDATEDEHYIFETRKREGFDLFIPSNPSDSVNQAGRLIIWQHKTHSNSPMNGYHDRIRIVPGDNNRNWEIQDQLNDFFPSTFSLNNLQDFNDISLPSATINENHPILGQTGDPAHFALNGIQKLTNGNTLIGEVRLNHQFVTIQNSGGWQTFSVPVGLSDYSSLSIFPDSSSVYRYVVNTYVKIDTMENGPGYWVKFPAHPQTKILGGIPIDSLVIPVYNGWNITGTVFNKFPVSDICTDPTGIIQNIYRYNGGYILLSPSDSLKPGIGYWTKTTNAGNIYLNAGPCGLSKINSIPEVNLETMDKFIVTDAAGNSQSLYVSNINIDTAIANIDLDLPPMFPEMDFDSRFQYGELVKKVSANSGTVDLSILVHSNSFPLSLEWVINPANGINYSFISDSGIGKISNINSSKGKTLFNNLANSKIQLFASADKMHSSVNQPSEYSLEQNYPNPFNPSTTIKYALKNDGKVTLKIYNVLGEEVKTLVDEVKSAGNYAVVFEASSLSSGIYIYKIKAGDFISSKKMIFLK